MPKFNLKDLMVSLEVQKETDAGQLCYHSGCYHLSPVCYHFTCFGITQACHFGCSVLISICPAGTCPGGSICVARTFVTCIAGTRPTCGITLISPWTETIAQEVIPTLDVKELGELKVALQGLVERIDTEFKPQKLEQLDTLESKLNEAMEDVKEQKKKFSK